MDEFLLAAHLDDDREIWISEVSRSTFDSNDIDDLGSDSGYFLLIGSQRPGGDGAKVIAKAASAEAALLLYELLTRGGARAGLGHRSRGRCAATDEHDEFIARVPGVSG
jgi:hypothetical protein